MKFMKLGRTHYVGYAVTLGFKSVNYQDEETGNTALHYAVHRGNVEQCTELLKYKAIPELRNKLGNAPIHDAWIFWNTNNTRTREQRIDQERKTCEILLLFLGYDTYVDSQDQYGNTALHNACRMGPIRAVLLLLGFKPNVNMLNKEGLTANDVAVRHKKHEIVKLLSTWPVLSQQMVKTDFVVQWKKFFANPMAEISNEQSAKDVIFQLTMQSNVKTVGKMKVDTLPDEMEIGPDGIERPVPKSTVGLVPIDDELWRQTWADGKRNIATPKPWDPSWEVYVDKCHKEGIYDPLETTADIKSLSARMGIMIAKREKAARLAAIRGKLPDRPTPDRILTAAAQSRTASRAAKRMSRATSQNALEGGADNSNGTAGGMISDGLIGTSPQGILGPTGGGAGIDISDTSGSSNTATTTVTTSSNNAFGHTFDGSASIGADVNIPITTDTDFGEIEAHMSATGPGVVGFERTESLTRTGSAATALLAPLSADSRTDKRPSSVIKQRRADIAHKVALDGKFINFTKRPASSSTLWLPLRTPNAPMYGTIEQDNILRIIASQGKDFDLMEKTKKENIYEKLGLCVDPKKSVIGAYSEAVEFSGSTDRDKLLFSIAGTGTGTADSSNDISINTVMDVESKGNALKREKVDMVGGRRKRFVDRALIPPKTLSNFIEQAHDRDHKAALEKQRIIDEKNKKLIGVSKLSDLKDDNHGKSDEEVMKMLNSRQSHLRAKEVKYGKGRLTSTHNCTGTLVEPWEHVPHSYATLPGDRTA